MTNLISSQSIPLSLAGADEASCAPKICDQAIPDNASVSWVIYLPFFLD